MNYRRPPLSLSVLAPAPQSVVTPGSISEIGNAKSRAGYEDGEPAESGNDKSKTDAKVTTKVTTEIH